MRRAWSSCTRKRPQAYAQRGATLTDMARYHAHTWNSPEFRARRAFRLDRQPLLRLESRVSEPLLRTRGVAALRELAARCSCIGASARSRLDEARACPHRRARSVRAHVPHPWRHASGQSLHRSRWHARLLRRASRACAVASRSQLSHRLCTRYRGSQGVGTCAAGSLPGRR